SVRWTIEYTADLRLRIIEPAEARGKGPLAAQSNTPLSERGARRKWSSCILCHDRSKETTSPPLEPACRADTSALSLAFLSLGQAIRRSTAKRRRRGQRPRRSPSSLLARSDPGM